MGAARVISSAEFEAEVLKSGAAIVDFTATWCGPCKVLGPEIDKMSAEYAGKALVVKVDVDQSPELASRFAVMSVPTVLFFQNGQKVVQINGTYPARIRERIDGMLES
jgi:thioredoxin 1